MIFYCGLVVHITDTREQKVVSYIGQRFSGDVCHGSMCFCLAPLGKTVWSGNVFLPRHEDAKYHKASDAFMYNIRDAYGKAFYWGGGTTLP